jgi:hypothetical protein
VPDAVPTAREVIVDVVAIATRLEGQLRFAVTASGGKVILAFGTPVEWIGMFPREADELADALNKWASEA